MCAISTEDIHRMETIMCLTNFWNDSTFGDLNSQRMSRPLPTIQHYKGYSNIDSTGNYEWFFTASVPFGPVPRDRLITGCLLFSKLNSYFVELAHRGGPRASLNKFARNERARVNAVIVILGRLDTT